MYLLNFVRLLKTLINRYSYLIESFFLFLVFIFKILYKGQNPTKPVANNIAPKTANIICTVF